MSDDVLDPIGSPMLQNRLVDGVDCACVERVIHWGLPNDVETYIQQTGRCGRSGQKSQCILLFGKGLKQFVDKQMLLSIYILSIIFQLVKLANLQPLQIS
uniref:DNA 3'-5' helicase n=1 Tax=Amphimedon queenslandica TaxID=400682 RepID=A0A1X7VK36_AMPQE